MKPLLPPIIIGGYGPRRDAWFAGRRGQGFVRSIDDVDCTQDLALRHHLARSRLALARYYRAHMSDEAGPVAAALVTGVRGAIDKSVRDAFRHSGLAHMLAISGLHMALFAGSVYALLRFGCPVAIIGVAPRCQKTLRDDFTHGGHRLFVFIGRRRGDAARLYHVGDILPRFFTRPSGHYHAQCFMGGLIGFAVAAPCCFAGRISNEFFCRDGAGRGL